jgi:hypothetical protein
VQVSGVLGWWMIELNRFSLVLTKFTNALVKSRPLKEIGAEQVCAIVLFDAIGLI